MVNPFQPLGRFAARLVGEIVRDAREGVDGGNVRPQAPGQQPRRHREIFVMGMRERLASGVRLLQLARASYHGVSVVPARWFAALAIVNSRSESRLT